MTSRMSGVFAHLRSDTGRLYLGIASAVGCATVFSGYCVLHTFALEKYKNTIQLYHQGFPRAINKDVLKRAQEISNEMKIKMKFRSFIYFFSVFGFDPAYIGSLKTSYGGYIGIPYNFSYKTPVDIERGSIVVDTQPVSWNSDDGLNLQESLILSEKAQNFVIARQIAYINTHYVYAYALIHGGSLFLYQVLSNTANDKFQGFKRPKSFRYFVYSCIGLFCIGVWSVTQDFLSRYYDRYADRTAMELGIDYAKGGVEFYTKTLQRNISLRGLMTKGESRFTPNGNDNELFRQRFVPFTQRKENAEKKVQQYLSDGQNKSNLGNNNSSEKLLN